ncbi:hypothetical protein CkaCkLH20_01660 [Colletotrichum karsti]|uniref:NmrA-like domain-containing protein n=1 Tax=Colletotrichum karsti TaxID=1095194 RepID=A0A9P6LP34_9PEZI|nr:uncharacterized protein CkaCkLH20_01660 [Colletotrichum karsti]KAF9880618.1 hypothetical protein CkaCkLH20_01660 [Colletotrichum karsti]
MMKKLITVLGVTGTQGGSVASRFLSHPDWHVRGLTRKPDSAKAKYWAGRGVEVIKGDYDDLDSLRIAFSGAHAIFAVTDWAANYARVVEDAALQEKAKAAGRSFEEFAGDLEEAQGINLAVAALDPVVLSTLERFVFSTLPAVQLISGGKYKHSYEFDSKAGAERYMRAHLSFVLSTVTLGIFQETWRDIAAFRPHKQPDGTFEYVNLEVSGPHDANPEVVATRDTGAFVEALILHHPPGTDVLGATEIISKRDYAALWGRTLGVQTTVRDVSEEEYVRYVPDAYKTTIVDDLRFFAEFGYTGGNAKVKTPAELGIKTSSLVEYFRDEDWSDVLEGRL